MHRRHLLTLLALLGVLALTGCGGGTPGVASTTTGAHSSTTPSQVTDPAATTTVPPRTVVLDPGHNGANAANPGFINRPVPDGRGGTKACNTTGTATDAGYPEHAFTWDVGQRVRDLLGAYGFQVVLTRPDDTSVGPCVDERAAIGNRAGADAVVSIHADGADSPGAHGFHVAYADPSLPDNAAAGSLSLATAMRAAMSAHGYEPSTYVGSDGLDPRPDLAGLNLSTQPAVLVECGNMRDDGDAAEMIAPAGRQRTAEALADGIRTYLART